MPAPDDKFFHFFWYRNNSLYSKLNLTEAELKAELHEHHIIDHSTMHVFSTMGCELELEEIIIDIL